MKIRHIGLMASSEPGADKFFGELLGLQKQESKSIPAALSQALFRVNADIKVIRYTGRDTDFEVFIHAPETSGTKSMEHVCLEIDDLPAFLQRCRNLQVTILQVPKGDSLLTFISDGDQNLFEIKEKRR